MDTYNFVSIVCAGLALPSMLSIYLSYVYLKQHVRIEKRIKKMFINQLHAHQLRHVHPKKPKYKQCHFLYGFSFLIEDLEYKENFLKKNNKTNTTKDFFYTNGLFEKKLPDTIASDFEFKKPQDIQNLLGCMKNILETSGYIVTEDTFHHDSILVGKKKYSVRVSIVQLVCENDLCVRYRLVCTWLFL